MTNNSPREPQTSTEKATELRRAIAGLLANPEGREQMVQNAHNVLDAHRGATERTAELVVHLRSVQVQE